MKGHEVIENLCETVSLIYLSIGDYDEPSDGFCAFHCPLFGGCITPVMTSLKDSEGFTHGVDITSSLWYAVVMKTKNIHPLPWMHQTNGKKMSAVIDAEGKIVCRSLICQQSDPDKTRETHAFIVKAVGREQTCQ